MVLPAFCWILAAIQKKAYDRSIMLARFVPHAFAGLLLSSVVALAAAEDFEYPDQTAALVAATDAYFSRVEIETSKSRTPAMTIALPNLAQRTSADVETTDTLTQNGPVQHLTGYRINWYPVDRFLGSVDFMGTWGGNRNLVCGYLIWDMSTPGAPVLDAVSASFVDIDDLSGKPSAYVHRRLLEANCAFGSLDDNYAFF